MISSCPPGPLSKAEVVMSFLKNRLIYSVHAEAPSPHGLVEQDIEAPQGISCTRSGETLTFAACDKTLSFTLLSDASIVPYGAEDGEVLTTLAANGGLQIKYRC